MSEIFTHPSRSNSIMNINKDIIQIRKQIANAVMHNKNFVYTDCPKDSESLKRQLCSEGYTVLESATCFKIKWKISWC